MGVVAATLGLQPGAHRLRVHEIRQRTDLPGPFAQAQPDDPRQAAALEGARVAQREQERRGMRGLDSFRDPLGQRPVDVSEKPDREVEILDRRPAKLGSKRRARRQESP